MSAATTPAPPPSLATLVVLLHCGQKCGNVLTPPVPHSQNFTDQHECLTTAQSSLRCGPAIMWRASDSKCCREGVTIGGESDASWSVWGVHAYPGSPPLPPPPSRPPPCSFLWLWFAVVATLWRSIPRSVQRKALALTWLPPSRKGTAKQPHSLTPAVAQKTHRRSDRSNWPVQLAGGVLSHPMATPSALGK